MVAAASTVTALAVLAALCTGCLAVDLVKVDPATNTSKLQTIITNIDIAAANKANVKASLLEPFSNKSVVLQNNAAAVQQIKAKLNDEATKPGPMCAATDACPAAAAGAISLSEVNVLNAEFTLFNFNLEVTEYFSPLAGATPINQNNQANTDGWNPADCFGGQRPITSYKTGSSGGGSPTYSEWIYVDPTGTNSEFSGPCSNPVDSSLGQAPTCNTLCARRNKKCDPCPMSLLSCQNNLYYALGQAGVDMRQILREQLIASVAQSNPGQGQFQVPPGAPGPWTQTTCPDTSSGAVPADPTRGASSSLSGTNWGPYPGLEGTYRCVGGKWTNVAGDQISTAAPQYQVGYWRPPNFWQPSQPNYVDPTTLCDVPVWKMLDSEYINMGALCYCQN